MKLSSRSALALLLGTALAGSLSSCDYQWTPGVNTQFRHGFNNPPGWRNVDVNRDSINYKQETTPPIGVGSATAIANGTVQEQLNSAPAGQNATAPQSASGTMAPVGTATNGDGNKNDKPQPK
ncbi:hypothetical protein [Hymenobacter sp. IS2118]|uniref:hypothetical protein n=1 Tax=Hymenobacter sp. IS2118 TaxID=1505605 RepID=UPI00055032BC|nr:hypothetical protein [Hymenobacter sp. IS2118]